MSSTSYNPSGMSALINCTSLNLTAAAHIGGVLALTAATVGSIVLTSSSGTVLCTVPAASPAGVYPVASSGGANGTAAALSSASDIGKAYVALLGVGTTL